MKKAQGGFTLIELVVVIVILGILAAVALPKFVNMSSQARVAKMNGAVGAVKSATALVHAQYLAGGSTATTLTLEGQSVTLTNGYPDAASIAVAAGLDDSYVSDSTTTSGTASISDKTKSTCLFTYQNAASTTTAPTITVSSITEDNC